jgi:hypothetical protein
MLQRIWVTVLTEKPVFFILPFKAHFGPSLEFGCKRCLFSVLLQHCTRPPPYGRLMQRRDTDDEGALRAIRRNRRRRVSTCMMRVKIIEWSSIGVLMRLGILCFCAYFILRLLLVRLFVAYIASRVSAALPCYPPHPPNTI